MKNKKQQKGITLITLIITIILLLILSGVTIAAINTDILHKAKSIEGETGSKIEESQETINKLKEEWNRVKVDKVINDI